MNIYQITKEIELLLSSLPETGEMSEEVIEAYGNLQQSLTDKQKNTILYWKHINSQKESIEAEMKRLKVLKDTKEKHLESIEKLISYTMQNSGAKTLDFGICKASFRKSSAVIVEDQDALDKKYIVEKTTYAPDKTSIKNAIKSGEVVVGAHIEERESLNIQ